MIKTIAIVVLILLCAVLALGTKQGYDHHARAERLTLALDIWQRCPLPPPSADLAVVIQTRWPGKLPHEAWRCSVAPNAAFGAAAPAPPPDSPYLKQCAEGGLCR